MTDSFESLCYSMLFKGLKGALRLYLLPERL